MNPIKREHLKLLLTPSLLSASIGVFVGLVLIVGAIIISAGKAGHLRNDLFAVKYVSRNLNGRYHSISQSLSSNHFINQLGLLVFWAVVGLIAYLFTISLFRLIMNLAYFRKSLNYTHAKPHQMFTELFLHLTARLASLVAGWVVIRVCFKNVLPYFLAVISDASGHWTVENGLKLVAITLILVLIWHALTIILRLLMLKPRIFG